VIPLCFKGVLMYHQHLTEAAGVRCCASPADDKGVSFGLLGVAIALAEEWTPDQYLVSGETAM
jgi:hypothetical protein